MCWNEGTTATETLPPKTITATAVHHAKITLLVKSAKRCMHPVQTSLLSKMRNTQIKIVYPRMLCTRPFRRSPLLPLLRLPFDDASRLITHNILEIRRNPRTQKETYAHSPTTFLCTSGLSTIVMRISVTARSPQKLRRIFPLVAVPGAFVPKNKNTRRLALLYRTSQPLSAKHHQTNASCGTLNWFEGM